WLVFHCFFSILIFWCPVCVPAANAIARPSGARLSSRVAFLEPTTAAPMATSSQKILAELVDQITSKRNLYRSAYSADLKRLESAPGAAAIAEALQLVVERDARRDAGSWDPQGHAVQVRQAVDRLLQRRQPQDHRFR